MKLHKHFYIAAAILAASATAARVYFGWLVHEGMDEAVPLSKPLATIPLELGDWQGMESKMDSKAQLKIGAEEIFHRIYYRGEESLRLYIAYFGGIRGMAPHSPTVCMPGAGFELISSDTISLKVPGFGEEPLRVHKDLFERNFEKVVVVWWEYIHGENVASRMVQRIKWALPACLGGKRGSVLQVQLSLQFTDSMEESMRRVADFMNQLGPFVRAVLPKAEDPTRQTEDGRYDSVVSGR
ncbi:MAG: hypothetical protein AMK75_00145 [Planctomycetes bacterium SM23_65]|nr:MAG: hypothetical protein AMK75_00145 [Planctomycetes bacterium SM23_65]